MRRTKTKNQELDELIIALDHAHEGGKEDAADHRHHAALPEIVINNADPTATAKELAVLIATRGSFLFNGYAPVRVAVEANCLPRALEVTVEAVRVHAHEICRPIKLRNTKGGIERIPVPLTKDIALLYLNGLEGLWGLSHFRGITTAPILKSDGSIRSASGYDAETGLWCHNIPELTIANRPTRRDAEAALHRLRFFFRTFPFADSQRMKDAALGVEVIDLDRTDRSDSTKAPSWSRYRPQSVGNRSISRPAISFAPQPSAGPGPARA